MRIINMVNNDRHMPVSHRESLSGLTAQPLAPRPFPPQEYFVEICGI